MRAKDYERILNVVASMIDEGVHIVDSHGCTIFYSDVMADLEQQRKADVVGKPFREVFSHIPLEESTLYQALQGGTSENIQQTYRNKYGKQVTTVNSTFPVKSGDEIIAAVEVANDITRIKSMSDKIRDLQEGKFTAGESEEEPHIPRYVFDDIVGRNPEFLQQIERAKKAAQTIAPVFICGATGTGKELFAQSIHYCGIRKNKPFLAQNCAALPESLLEGILFGTVKGGFTGAENRAGLFEQANGGTLLLDEVSAMPYGLQSKMFRVLQENYIRRVGGSEDIPVDVRIISTINRPVEQLFAEKALMPDLYYRLDGINIEIPPLKDRDEDIPILARAFLDKYCKKMGINVIGFTGRALDKLRRHDYPGNVRELENIIMSAVSLAEDGEILDTNDLDIRKFKQESGPLHRGYNPAEECMTDYLEKMEKSILEETLRLERGNISRAAEVLGIKRQTLQHKIKKYDLKERANKFAQYSK